LNVAPPTSGLMDTAQLAKALGVTPRRVRQMAEMGMPCTGSRPGEYRYELPFCRLWMERHLLDHHGGRRPGAGRPARNGAAAKAGESQARETPPTGPTIEAVPTALETAIAGGLVLERPEDIKALLGKVSAREAATIRSMVASMRQLHDLQVEQGKYVMVAEVESRVARMVTDAASMMEDATRRASDAIAAKFGHDAPSRASIESLIRDELARVREALAGRKS